jgi:hypothetical protein
LIKHFADGKISGSYLTEGTISKDLLGGSETKDSDFSETKGWQGMNESEENKRKWRTKRSEVLNPPLTARRN